MKRLLLKPTAGTEFLTQATKPYYSKAIIQTADTAIMVNGVSYDSVVVSAYCASLEWLPTVTRCMKKFISPSM